MGRAVCSAARALAGVWLALAAVACVGAEVGGDAVRVGVLLPFTGRESGPSHNFERAVLFARARTAGVGLGGRPFEIVFADTHSQVKRGLAEADALLDQGVVAIIGPESAELSEALLPRLRARGVLLISPGILAETSLASPGMPWIRVAPSTRAMAENLAKRLLAQKVPEVMALMTEDRYNASFAITFARRFMELGGVSTLVTLPDDRSSYSEVVATIEGRRHVLLAARAETAALFINEMSVFPTQPQWHLPPALRADVFVQNASPKAVAGATGITPEVAVPPDYREAFARHWDGDTPLESALFFYDALALVALGYERAHQKAGGPPTAAEIQDGIFATAFNNGIPTEWNELADALRDLRDGVGRYYRGLTGSIVLGPDGQRGFGRDKLWTIGPGGAIVDLE